MANPAVQPDVEVANRIHAATAQTGCVLGTNLFHGPVQPPSDLVPHACVFVLDQGGPPPTPYFGTAKQDFRQFVLEVFCRSNVDDYTGGQATARAIWAALQRVTPGGSGYFSITCREAYPTYLGKDDTEHHRWSINIEVWYKG